MRLRYYTIFTQRIIMTTFVRYAHSIHSLASSSCDAVCSTFKLHDTFRQLVTHVVGCVAQLVERRSLTGELSLSCARPAADG